MRKLVALVLAIPVIAAIYVGSLLNRNLATRIGAGIASAGVLGLVIVTSVPPASTSAVLASRPAPVSATMLDAVSTGHALGSPFVVRFGAPMDGASVAAALRLQPQSAFSLRWDAAGTTLRIAPVGHWQPDTLYSISVDGTARADSGAVLATPVRALILTRRAGKATIEATSRVGGRVGLDTSFSLRLDRPASTTAVLAALRTEPAVAGRIAEGSTPTELVFVPAAPLAPETTYRIWLAGLRDQEGVEFSAAPEVRVTTVAAPEVVRFRPQAGTRAVDRSALLSVRFTERMDRKRTAAAFHASVDGKTLPGRSRWAEKDTVLVFDPTTQLPWGVTVTLSVDASARSRAGVALASRSTATFRVGPRPAPRPKAKPAAKPSSKPISHSGGGGAVSGSWKGVEAYYLKLMNCTRTGGWVTSGGKCSSPGGRNVAPLALNASISSKVSRPYAKMLATRGLCDHFIGGTPGDRLRRAGFTSYRWAENLGCRSGNPYSAVLGSHLFFQSERPYNGGHYKNLMNAAYDRVGIGVWVSGGRVRLVVDFYHP